MEALKEIINQHFVWRKQVFLLAKSDIIKTYSGAALGWAWALVKPLITISVFWFAFTYGLRSGGSVNGFPFALWMIPGFMAWFYMSDMLNQGANSIRKYRYLVTKMKFPVSTIPTFISMSKLAIHMCLMCIVAIIFVVTGHFPQIYWLQVFFYMFLMFAFWTAWGLFASMLGAMSRDFINLVKSISTAVFWLSGIMWDVNGIDIPWLQKVLYFNPVTYLATGYRNCFIYHRWFWEEPLQLVIFLGLLLVMVIMAVWSYRKLIREIPDVL
ncbi:MAG: ABC transporter permease [Firmicutes bacterium]|nr:ABC transporter permease [Bacillota bacterium]